MRRCGRSAPAWTLGASIPVILMHQVLRPDPHAWLLLRSDHLITQATKAPPALYVLPVGPAIDFTADELPQSGRRRVERSTICDHGAVGANRRFVGHAGANSMVLEFVARADDSGIEKCLKFASPAGSPRGWVGRAIRRARFALDEQSPQDVVGCLEALHVAREECVDLVVDLDGLHFSFPFFLEVLLSCRESMPDFLITQGGPR